MFKKDDLFSVVIMDDSELTSQLKHINRKSTNITREYLLENQKFNDTLIGWYYLSAEVGIFNLAESPYRKSHGVTEYFVILSLGDIKKASGLASSFSSG
jgi:hypothetical protein